MTEFLYIYRGGNMPTAPDERQKHAQEWTAWIKELGAAGHIKNPGQPLEQGGKVVSASAITDGPYAETKDVIGGYSIILANDIQQAAELAKGCPGHRVGGLVEVRPTIQIDM